MMSNKVVKIPCRTSVDSRRVQEAKWKASRPTEFPYSPTKKRLRSSESCFRYRSDVEDDSVNSNCSLTTTQKPCFICEKKHGPFTKLQHLMRAAKCSRAHNYELLIDSEGDMIASDAEWSGVYHHSPLTNDKELALIELIDLIKTYYAALPMSKVVAAHEKRLKSPNVGLQLIVHTSRQQPTALGPYPRPHCYTGQWPQLGSHVQRRSQSSDCRGKKRQFVREVSNLYDSC